MYHCFFWVMGLIVTTHNNNLTVFKNKINHSFYKSCINHGLFMWYVVQSKLNDESSSIRIITASLILLKLWLNLLKASHCAVIYTKQKIGGVIYQIFEADWVCGYTSTHDVIDITLFVLYLLQNISNRHGSLSRSTPIDVSRNRIRNRKFRLASIAMTPL